MTCPVGSDTNRAAKIVRSGGLVAFATETVYGLGGNALDARVVARLFEVKGRPSFDPMIAHVSDFSKLKPLTADISPTARQLAETFWPGPLTLVLPKTDRVPDLLTAGLPTIAVRIPDHLQALEFLSAVNLPVAAPSANLFGCISPTCAEHVVKQLGEKIDYVLDGGTCKVGVESTVLQLTGGPPLLLRPGGLPVETIESAIGTVTLPDTTAPSDSTAQPAPGMLPRHYAPSTPLLIESSGTPPHLAQRAGLLTFLPIADTSGYQAIEVLSNTGDLTEAAANFFAALHRLDAIGLDLIIATPFPQKGLGRALNDRLRRAAKKTA